MASKRKAARAHDDLRSVKRRSAPVPAPAPSTSPSPSPSAPSPPVAHPLLQRFYPAVLTLRQYLLVKLAATSNRKHRRVAHLGLTHGDDTALCTLLDDTWVGCGPALTPEAHSALNRDWDKFSQDAPSSSSGSTIYPELQSEIVNFVIRSLFKKFSDHKRPPHLLCHGFQCASFTTNDAPPGPSGIVSFHHNQHVETLKGPPWSDLLVALGHGGESLMIELLMSCGIFAVLQGSCGNCYQLSGTPLADIDPTTPARALQNHCGQDKPSNPAAEAGAKRKGKARDNLTTIRFVRSRILYARPALNARGRVRFGLRHIHVLNRLPDHASFAQTIHVMKYVFPRQFGLHNVFTSKTDYRETSHPFKDYTLREKEIAYARLGKLTKLNTATVETRDAIPKRLRGQAIDLVRRLRTLHNRCAYVELLRHYCPSSLFDAPQESIASLDVTDHSTVPSVQKGHSGGPSRATLPDHALPRPISAGSIDKVCFTDFATSTSQVSAFCRAAMKNVVPNQFWGEGDVQQHNKRIFLKHVDRFVSIRRNESLTLHEVLQDMKVADIGWLRPPQVSAGEKLAKTDFDKRREIFQEFIYYLFDSFLILLIRSNFHVTESNVDKNHLFYFRHDVWKMLVEPAISNIKSNMFEEVETKGASRFPVRTQLGYSQVRLLPKKAGARPISNLRRRMQATMNGKTMLGRSINSILKPVFNVLNYEKSAQPHLLGSSMFSVGDIFPRIRAFRTSLEERGLAEGPLYFAKIDVKSCFDTIPQKKLVELVERIVRLEEYRVAKHVEVQAAAPYKYSGNVSSTVQPVKKYVSKGKAAGETCSFEDSLKCDKNLGRSNTVFVDLVVEQAQRRQAVLQLLAEHVNRNIVKIGKKYYRQRQGIPQGSILSSLLCNFFYADMEMKLLSFLSDDGVLLRLIDDSLLVTRKREHAEQFLRIMYAGNADYGVGIKKEKTLVNFDMVVDGALVPRVPLKTGFPFCGTMIDTESLNLRKEEKPKTRREVRDGLTVEYSRLPGQTFHRKTLNGLKIQLHGMFLDTSFNELSTVLTNLFQCFLDAAQRSFEYVKSLPGSGRRRSNELLIKTVEDVCSLAAGMTRRRQRRRQEERSGPYRSDVSRRHGRWLACRAFDRVFRPRQTNHAAFVGWLRANLAQARPTSRADCALLERVVSLE